MRNLGASWPSYRSTPAPQKPGTLHPAPHHMPATLLFHATRARLRHALLLALLPVSVLAQGVLGNSPAITTVVQSEQARAELMAHAPDGAGPGKTAWVGLQLTHAPEWHTYWKNSGDSGLPTELQWTLPHGVSAGPIAWPTPRKFPIGNLANYGYDGTVVLPVPLAIGSCIVGVPMYSALTGNFTIL